MSLRYTLKISSLLVLFGLSALLAATQTTARQVSTPVVSPPAAAPSWWDNAVCYEVFVRSFSDSNGDGIGDFPGLTAKLDYLNDGDPTTTHDLGVTCLWLMPIFESPSYHGYDVVDYEAIDRDYGTMDDFTTFLDDAHQRGIRVILDLPLNHTGVDHPWFQDALMNSDSPYHDWYIWSADDPGYLGPWGQVVWHPTTRANGYYYGIFWEGMPDLNYRNPDVTAEARRISRFWLDKGVDGYRLDAIKHLIEDGPIQEDTPETHAWLEDYGAFLAADYPDVLTIGEIFGATTSTLTAYFDPPQLTGYYHFGIADELINAVNSGSGNNLTTVVSSALASNPSQSFSTFLTNHDQTRAMTVIGGDVNEAKLAATALLTLPGLPFIYYGEEVGMTGDKPDERLRTPMQWSADALTGGFTSSLPWEPFQDNQSYVNVASQAGDPASLLNHYRRLIHLHAVHPALGSGDFIPITISTRGLTAYLRVDGDDIVLVILNFGDERENAPTFTLAAGALTPGTYNLESLLGGMPAPPMTLATDGTVSLWSNNASIPANATLIYALTPA